MLDQWPFPCHDVSATRATVSTRSRHERLSNKSMRHSQSQLPSEITDEITLPLQVVFLPVLLRRHQRDGGIVSIPNRFQRRSEYDFKNQEVEEVQKGGCHIDRQLRAGGRYLLRKEIKKE